MKKTIVILLIALSSMLAEKVPFERLGESDLPVIRTKVRFTTLVVLPDGEEVADVICGDKDYWVIEGKDSIVYVKPAKERARTNVNVISKSKTVYSFLVQEISNPAHPKEKPDLKVLLGGDELPKLKKDKENLEELLAHTERSLREAKAKNDELREKAEAEKAKKKDEAAPPQVAAEKGHIAQWEDVPPDPKVKREVARVSSRAPSVAKSVASPAKPAAVPVEEKPIARAYVIQSHEGLVRKGGRAVGHFLRRISRALRLY